MAAVYIIALATGALSLGAFVVAGLQFAHKGPIFTNAYLLGTPKERAKLDKPAEYRLAGTVFATLGGVFALVTASLFTGLSWLNHVAVAAALLLVVCVVVREVKSGAFR